MDEPTIDDESAEAFRLLGITGEPRSPCQANAAGYVILRNWWGDHARGLNGFDARCCIDGLQHVIESPSVEVAEYVWNSLLPAHRRHVRGIIQRSSRQNYEPASTRESEGYSATGKLLIETAWLPDKGGILRKPAELTLADLPDSFTRDEELASQLNLKPVSVAGLDKDTLLRAAGLAPDVARLLQENSEIFEFLARRPEVLQKVRNELESAMEDNESVPANLDYQSELAAAFSRSGRDVPAEDDLEVAGQMPDPERRRQKLREEIRARRDDEPSLSERFTKVPRIIWESKNSAVRTFLEEEYDGRCQICDFTFVQRSGRRYFEGAYLISHTRARWIDRPGNVLCLCANCCARFVYGEVAADDILEQIDLFRASKEGGVANPSVRIQLCGEEGRIRFSERHMLDLQELVRTSGEPEASPLQNGEGTIPDSQCTPTNTQ